MTFGQLMTEYLERHRITPAALADKLFMDRAFVYRVRADRQAPSERLAAALDQEFTTTAFTAMRTEQMTVQAKVSSRVDPAHVAALRRMLDATRHLDDTIGSAAVRPTARTHLGQVTRMVRAARGPGRDDLVDVAAGWAILTGWLEIATGQWRNAATALTRAWEWSAETADPTLQSIALTFQAYQALTQRRYDRALGLSQAASRISGAHPAQQAYTVLQLARVYAELDEPELARPFVDRAHAAIAAAAVEGPPPEPIYWSTTPFFQLHLGKTLTIMGETDDAVAYLRGGLDGLPDAQSRAEWTQKYRTALDAAVRA